MQQNAFHQRFTSSTFVPYICLFCHTFVKSTRPPQYYSLPPLATTYYCNYLIRISLLLNLHIAYCAPALPLHLFQASTLPCFHIHHDQGKFVQTITSRQARHISGGEKTKQTGISSGRRSQSRWRRRQRANSKNLLAPCASDYLVERSKANWGKRSQEQGRMDKRTQRLRKLRHTEISMVKLKVTRWHQLICTAKELDMAKGNKFVAKNKSKAKTRQICGKKQI